MNFTKSLVCCASVSVAFSLDLAKVSSAYPLPITPHRLEAQVQPHGIDGGIFLKQSNPPPPPNNPGSSAAGGRRDASTCPQDVRAIPPDSATPSSFLTALSPTTVPGLTLADHPTFLVYVPTTSAERAEFSLRDQEGHGIYRTTVALPPTPAIVSINLPAQTTALEVGKPYTWAFAVICNPDDRLEDQFVTATVQRVELNPIHDRSLEQTSISDRLVLYQENGIWYDALALLFELRRNQPPDPSLATTWHEFLQSGGIDSPIDINSVSN